MTWRAFRWLAIAGLLGGCAAVGSTFDHGLDQESRERFAEPWRRLKMQDADIAAMRLAIDPDADPGKIPVPLTAGSGTVTLSGPGWQGCRSIDMSAAFADTAAQHVDAHLFGLICPPQPIAALGHWHLSRLQVLSPLPPPPPPPEPHKDDKSTLGQIFAKPAVPAPKPSGR